MKELRFDDRTFKQTAQAVYAINDSVRERYTSADHLYDFMYSMGFAHMEKSGFFATGGFCLSAYEDDNTRTVVATVMAYTVNKYLDDQ